MKKVFLIDKNPLRIHTIKRAVEKRGHCLFQVDQMDQARPFFADLEVSVLLIALEALEAGEMELIPGFLKLQKETQIPVVLLSSNQKIESFGEMVSYLELKLPFSLNEFNLTLEKLGIFYPTTPIQDV